MLRHRLVAHRGYQKAYPENTLIGFQAAVDAGALYLETDIQFSKDDRPILCHDEFLAKVGGVEGFIRDKLESELCSLPAGEPFRLGDKFNQVMLSPLSDLVSFLESAPQVHLFVEAKEEAIAAVGVAKAFDIILESVEPIYEQAILISFDANFVNYAQKRGFRQTGLVLKEWQQIWQQSPYPNYIFVDKKLIPQDAILTDFESLIVVYEVADPKEAVALFDRGADMIETFDIAAMIESLSSHSL